MWQFYTKITFTLKSTKYGTLVWGSYQFGTMALHYSSTQTCQRNKMTILPSVYEYEYEYEYDSMLCTVVGMYCSKWL